MCIWFTPLQNKQYEKVIYNKIKRITTTTTKMAFYSTPSTARPRTLMEALLAKKIEAASADGIGPGGSRLLRTDSLDSNSSLGSMIFGDDVCRCDDCLLGIVDLYTIGPAEKVLGKKKVWKLFFI